jgi:hypothetical protein
MGRPPKNWEARMKFRKASPAEREAYWNKEDKPVYPLHGWVEVKGVRCAVEFPNEGREGPKYEVMAPEGYHFKFEGLHHLCCFSMADIKSRLAGESLEACSKECNWSA